MKTPTLFFLLFAPICLMAQENCEDSVNTVLKKWDSKATFSSPASLTKESERYKEPRVRAKTRHFDPVEDMSPDEVVVLQKGNQEDQSVIVYLKNKKIVGFTQFVSNFEKSFPKGQFNTDLPTPKHRSLTTELDANCRLAKVSLGHEGLFLTSRFQTSMTGQECLDPKTSATAYYEEEVKNLKKAEEAQTQHYFERRAWKSTFDELAEKAYVNLDDPAEVKEFRDQQEKRVKRHYAKVYGEAIAAAGRFRDLKVSLCGLYEKEMLPPRQEGSTNAGQETPAAR